MNSPVKDPRSLTKDRLKAELSNHNVSLPPSDSRKDVYVDLYRQHILAPAASVSAGSKYAEAGNRARLEALSSDEEDFDHPVTHKKTKMTNGETDPIMADEVDSLTDDELYMALARRGETVGPILDSTRRVYQKKLKRLLTNETEATGEYTNGHHEEHHEDEFSDQEYDEEPMETEIISPPYNKEPEPSRQRQRQPQPERSAPVARTSARSEELVRPVTIVREQRVPPPGDEKPVITHRSTYKSTKNATNDKKDHGENDIVSQVNEVSEQTLASINTQRQQLKQKQGISVRLQVFVIAVCALVVFLVLSNMEPAYDNPAAIDAQAQV